MNYYVSQVLSGSGYFRKYLHRMGKIASPYYVYEEGEVINDAEYTVLCTLAELLLYTDVSNWNDHGRSILSGL